MNIGKTLYVTNRKSWRAWLRKNHSSKKEIWLVFYKRASGKPRIEYNDAVEEALCYGWIDSTVKSIDEKSFAQRFTPRKPKSTLSEPNKIRIRKLIANKKMTRAGLKAIEHLMNIKQAGKKEKLKVPEYILKPLKADPEAWKHFQRMPPDYKKIRIAYLQSQRKHGREQYQRALKNFIKKTAANKLIGNVKTI